mgnify:CR=1 FL=1
MEVDYARLKMQMIDPETGRDRINGVLQRPRCNPSVNL